MTKSMSSVSSGADATPAADPAATPRGEDGDELQISEEMEPSLERTKGATGGGLRKRRLLRNAVQWCRKISWVYEGI